MIDFENQHPEAEKLQNLINIEEKKPYSIISFDFETEHMNLSLTLV